MSRNMTNPLENLANKELQDESTSNNLMNMDQWLTQEMMQGNLESKEG